jgi:hypothetical protein
LKRSTAGSIRMWLQVHRSILGRGALLVSIAGGLSGSFGGCHKLIGFEDKEYLPVGGQGAVNVRASALCNKYCDEVTSACNLHEDLPLPYFDRNECLGFCSKLEDDKEPVPGTDVTPIECRINKAIERENPVASCGGSSPTAGGLCGDVCETFCALYEDTCSDFCEKSAGGLCTIVAPDVCQRQCASLRVDSASSILPQGTFDRTVAGPHYHDSDTLQCRFLHLMVAIASEGKPDAQSHCGHASLNSNLHCYDPAEKENLNCEEYCKVVEGACPADEEFAVYENEEQCIAVCEAMDRADRLGKNRDGSWVAGQPLPDDAPNTIGCRRTHSYFAFASPDSHCTHAGPTTSSVCGGEGSACESFCILRRDVCDPELNEASCLRECAALEGATGDTYTVASGKAAGNDFDCRVLHLTRALEAQADDDAAKTQMECAIARGEATCRRGN